jgi:hypothetical protein
MNYGRALKMIEQDLSMLYQFISNNIEGKPNYIPNANKM